MNATTVAVDLAKNVFELVAADERWKVVERARLTRSQFGRWLHNRAVRLVVMRSPLSFIKCRAASRNAPLSGDQRSTGRYRVPT